MSRTKRLLLPLSFAAGGALLTWAGSLLIPDRYTSSAMIRMAVEPYPEADLINRTWQEAVGRKTLKSIIERLNLYPEERQRLPLEDAIEAMKKEDISLDIPPDHTLHLAFAYHDSAGAQAAAQALMDELVRASDVLYQQDPGWGRIEIAKPAGPAESGFNPAFWRPRRYVAQGSLVVRRKNFPVDKEAAEKRTAEIKQKTVSTEYLDGLISRFNLYPTLRESEESREEMRRNLHIQEIRTVLVLRFTYFDARLAQSTLAGVIEMLVDETRSIPKCEPSTPSIETKPAVAELESELFLPDRNGAAVLLPSAQAEQRFRMSADGPCRDPQAPAWQNAIDILDPASLPEEPDGPSRTILAIFGFFLGLGLWVVRQ